MDAVYLSVGTNLGDRESNLRAAFSMAAWFLHGIRASRVYQTAPLYVEDQPAYLNVMIAGMTDLGPFDLLEEIHRIENALGRDRSREKRRGPRPLDIDIVLYGDLVLNTPALTIPHPGALERAFVLVPLLDLAPEARDPLRGVPYRDALEAVRDQIITPVDMRLE